MSVIDFSANTAHMTTVNLSETQMQADTAAAAVEDAAHGFIVYNGVTYPDLPTATRAISTAHYRRCYLSAVAQNISIAPYQDALATLGTGPYGLRRERGVMTSELADPDALISSGKTLLDCMPSTAPATKELLRTPPRAKHEHQADRLRRWFEWVGTRVGNGQLVSHCVTEEELRAAWLQTKSA
jgi:hypothetical protein